MGAFLFAFVMSDLEKLHTLCAKTYKQQAVWFLNCFWQDFAEKEAEIVWQYVDTNSTLDLENHEEGSGLDEMKAHVFLEKFDEALTVRAMREKLRSTGAIGETERPKTVPLTHYLLYKYNADWNTLVDETRQGDNKEEMEKAERLLAEVQAAFRDSEEKASAARKALIEAQSSEAEAKKQEAEAREAEAQAVAKEEQATQREAEAVESENQAVAAEAQAVSEEEAAVASETQAKEREAEAVAAENQAKDRESAALASEEQAKQRESEAVGKENEAKKLKLLLKPHKKNY